MTAEVAILNRYGVALAADSAATITPKMKTYNTANKLFSLSKYEPIGIMIYGASEIMSTPWETLIKEYRRQLGRKLFNTVLEYAEDFLAFVNSSPAFSNEIQDQEFRTLTMLLYEEVKASINSSVEELLEQEIEVGEQEIEEIVIQTINRFDQQLSDAELLTGFVTEDVNEIRNQYTKVISEVLKDTFDKLPISGSSRRKLRRLPGKLVVSQNNFEEHWGEYSGVVVAGFGEEELFPSLIEYNVRNVIVGKLRYVVGREAKVDTRQRGIIIPFAQSDTVFAFMEGIDPYYLSVSLSYVRKLFRSYTKTLLDAISSSPNNPDGAIAFDEDELTALNSETDKLLQRFMGDMERYRRDQHGNPILTALSFLGKSELAEMAESLVNLASFKKRMTLEVETVGGPVDVVVISKGDGFIWINRKHYFDPRLNHSFFANYFGSAFVNEENNDDKG